MLNTVEKFIDSVLNVAGRARDTKLREQLPVLIRAAEDGLFPRLRLDDATARVTIAYADLDMSGPLPEYRVPDNFVEVKRIAWNPYTKPLGVDAIFKQRPITHDSDSMVYFRDTPVSLFEKDGRSLFFYGQVDTAFSVIMSYYTTIPSIVDDPNSWFLARYSNLLLTATLIEVEGYLKNYEAASYHENRLNNYIEAILNDEMRRDINSGPLAEVSYHG